MLPAITARPFSRLALAATLAFFSVSSVCAYDDWGETNTLQNDPGLKARFLWKDVINDGNKEVLVYNYEDDHLTSLVANLNYAAWKVSYASGDFDNNGCTDLAVGAPYATVAGEPAAGRVLVYYMEPDNSDPGTTFCTNPPCVKRCKLRNVRAYSHGEPQGPRHLPYSSSSGDPQRGAFVGFSLAAGDFNCDGKQDLAVGAPGYDLGSCEDCPRNAGGVFVGYGTGSGLDFQKEPASGTHSVMYTYWGASQLPAAFKLPSLGPLRSFALRGFSLAAGRFFGSANCTDLAIGSPGQDPADYMFDGDESLRGAGAVTVVAGTNHGLDAGHWVWNVTENGFAQVGASRKRHHLFGFSLAAGRFGTTSENGHEVLVIGTPGFDKQRGRVYLMNGGVNGMYLPAGNRACLDQAGEDCLKFSGSADEGDRLGFSLAVGDFDNDRLQDLAVGVPGEELGDCCDGEGAVALAKGNGNVIPLIPDANTLYNGNNNGNYDLKASQEGGDAVGFALASADFDGDGFDDLAIGVPGRNVGGARDGGAVVVKYGGCVQYVIGDCWDSRSGLAQSNRVQWMHQSAPAAVRDLAGNAGHNDLAGAAVHAVDIDRSGIADLMVGVPGEGRPDPLIAQSQPAFANDFQSYADGHTHVVSGTSAGLDARLETELRGPRKDTLNGELAVVVIPKRGNNTIQQGVFDLFEAQLNTALQQAPNGTRFGTPRYSAVDVLVPHTPVEFTTLSIVVWSNVIRFEVPVENGPVEGVIRGYVNVYMDAAANEMVMSAAWEPGPFNWLGEFLLQQSPGAGEGYQVTRSSLQDLLPASLRDELPPGVRLVRSHILPTMEIEIGVGL